MTREGERKDQEMTSKKEFTVNHHKYTEYCMDEEPPPQTLDNDHPQSGRAAFLLPLHFMGPVPEGAHVRPANEIAPLTQLSCCISSLIGLQLLNNYNL